MKKGTLIECVQDVIMKNGEKAFTKGNIYRTYPYTYRLGLNGAKTVICAKNDFNERHIIIENDEEFFNKHFVVALQK